MSEVVKKTVDRLREFSEALENGSTPKECANCGPLLDGETVVLIGLGLYCKECAPKERRKRNRNLLAERHRRQNRNH